MPITAQSPENAEALKKALEKKKKVTGRELLEELIPTVQRPMTKTTARGDFRIDLTIKLNDVLSQDPDHPGRCLPCE